MTLNDNNWQKILTKFDSFELELLKDINNNFVNDFFKTIRQYFENHSCEKWQIEEARKRTLRIMAILEELKKDLQLQSSKLLSQKSQFNSYLKSSRILNK